MVPVIAAGRPVQNRPVVPHHQHVRFPDVPVLELLLRLPVVELAEELTRFGDIEIIGGFYRQVGNSMHGGTTVWAGPNPMAAPQDQGRGAGA